MKLLLIDNYDSFTYNIAQYFGELGADVKVERNDALTLDDIRARAPDAMVFHAGTARDAAGRVVTAGGRVLGVTALGATIAEAVARAYAATGRLHFPGMRFRRDIGHRAGAAPAARP